MTASFALRGGLRAALLAASARGASTTSSTAALSSTFVSSRLFTTSGTAVAWRVRAAYGTLPKAAASCSATGVASKGVGAVSDTSGPCTAALPFALRHLRAASTGAGAAESSSILSEVLGSSKAVLLRDTLEDMSKEDSHMSYGELVKVIEESSGAMTDADAAKVCQTLVDAGVIIKLGDAVYLRPMELTRSVLKALPSVPSSVYGVEPEELKAMQEELEALDAKVESARASAAFNSKLVVGGGLIFLLSQLALFVRLTYVELSWDVMEPISYFVGLGNAIIVYLYFMYTNKDFSFDEWRTSMEKHYSKRKIIQQGIDWERYKSLARRIRRL